MAKKEQKKVYDDMRDSAHKIWLAGLGALAKAEQEGAKVFNSLVEAGEEFEARGKKRFTLVKGKVQEARDVAERELDKLGDTFDKLGDSFDAKVAGAVEKLGVPSREEIQRLTQRVEELTAKVDKIKPAPRARKTPTAVKKKS
jgi:poly(hydroxyalkanoate) granule-associated protein